MASGSLLATQKTQKFYVRGVGLRAKCQNCRWWQRARIDQDEICTNEDSDNRFDETHKDYGCLLWQQVPEQDGDATWGMG